MIALVFLTCLATEPDTCRERNLVFAENLTPMACAMQAQPILAEWRNGHPDWRIAGWRCMPADRLARKA